MMQRKTIYLSLALAFGGIFSPANAAQKHPKDADKTRGDNKPAELWQDLGDISTLNLLYGIGGQEHAANPTGKFTFVKEDMEGTNPKFTVQDENGVKWKVKLGEEAQPETAATRLLWAAGYYVDEDYYLAEIKVEGLPKLHRGENKVSADGIVHGARLERKSKEIKNHGNWDWFHNQCGTAQQLNGLRVMMALLNNWDLKTSNNSIDEVDGQSRCVVSDLGATFGKTGNYFTRSKSEPNEFERSNFISKSTPDTVSFVMHSRPSTLTMINVPKYRERARMEKITQDIPRADAKWIGGRLALLSENQIRDSFRAAGYDAEQVDGFTKALQDRIAQLNAL